MVIRLERSFSMFVRGSGSCSFLRAVAFHLLFTRNNGLRSIFFARNFLAHSWTDMVRIWLISFKLADCLFNSMFLIEFGLMRRLNIR